MNIKEKPEYFQVREIIDLDYNEEGKLSYFLLKKKNYNTLDAINLISKELKINTKNIGFAGNKDKKAITTQMISLPRITKEKVENLNLKSIILKFKGYGNKRINLGDLKGNKFKIKFPYKIKNKINFIENYFDEQRFGVNHNNHILGKLIIKKDFAELNSLINNSISNYNYKLKLRFYFHSYQSYLFNLFLSEYLSNYENISLDYSLGKLIFLKNKIKNIKIPLINFDTKLQGDIGKIYKKILKKEDVNLDSFLVRSHPFLVSDTQERDSIIKVKDLIQKNDFIYFSLPKGSYATILVKKLALLNNID